MPAAGARLTIISKANAIMNVFFIYLNLEFPTANVTKLLIHLGRDAGFSGSGRWSGLTGPDDDFALNDKFPLLYQQQAPFVRQV